MGSLFSLITLRSVKKSRTIIELTKKMTEKNVIHSYWSWNPFSCFFGYKLTCLGLLYTRPFTDLPDANATQIQLKDNWNTHWNKDTCHNKLTTVSGLTNSLMTLTNIPLQTRGSRNNHEFRFKKMKMSNRQRFGKNICRLFWSSNMLNHNLMIENFFSNEVIIHFNVLGSSMKYRIWCQGDCWSVVTPNEMRTRWRKKYISLSTIDEAM